MENSRKYRTAEFKKKRLKKRLTKISIFFGLLISLILLTAYISHLDRFKVKQISISGNNISNESEILQGIEKILSDRYFFLFSKRNSILIPRSEIENYIVENNVSIEKIGIKSNSLNELEISILEYEPYVIWCPNVLKETEDLLISNLDIEEDVDITQDIDEYILQVEQKNINECYLVNYSGVVYAKTNQSNPPEIKQENQQEADSDLMIFYSNSSEDFMIGESFLDENIFQNILVFIELIKDLDIEVNYVATNNNETFHLRTVIGPRILISRFNEPKQTAKNLGLAINIEEINAAQFRNLEYIDLRFDNRVFYRIK